MLPPLSHPEGLLLMQTGFAVAAPCSTCQWWLHRHYHPECKAKDHITTPPLSGIQAILLDQYCRPEIWVAIYNAGVILYSHGRHATLNDQSNFITQACNHLMTIGSSYLDLGVVVHPAYSSRCHGGFLWAIRCFQCLTNQADCLEMTLLPVPEAKKSLVALIFSLTSQTEWILYISVSKPVPICCCPLIAKETSFGLGSIFVLKVILSSKQAPWWTRVMKTINLLKGATGKISEQKILRSTNRGKCSNQGRCVTIGQNLLWPQVSPTTSWNLGDQCLSPSLHIFLQQTGTSNKIVKQSSQYVWKKFNLDIAGLRKQILTRRFHLSGKYAV